MTLYVFLLNILLRELCLPHGTAAKGKGSIPWCWNISSCLGIIVFLMGFQRKECISANYSMVQIKHYYVLGNNLHYGNILILCSVVSISSIWISVNNYIFLNFFPNGRLHTWCHLTAIKIIISLSIMHIKTWN